MFLRDEFGRLPSFDDIAKYLVFQRRLIFGSAPCVSVEHELFTALNNLVNKLEEIHKDKRYEAVWISYHIHGGVYTGPQYDMQLLAAKKAIHSLIEGKKEGI